MVGVKYASVVHVPAFVLDMQTARWCLCMVWLRRICGRSWPLGGESIVDLRSSLSLSLETKYLVGTEFRGPDRQRG